MYYYVKKGSFKYSVKASACGASEFVIVIKLLRRWRAIKITTAIIIKTKLLMNKCNQKYPCSLILFNVLYSSLTSAYISADIFFITLFSNALTLSAGTAETTHITFVFNWSWRVFSAQIQKAVNTGISIWEVGSYKVRAVLVLN